MTEIKSGRGRVKSFEYVAPEEKQMFSKGPWKWGYELSGDKIGISDGEGMDIIYVNHSECVVIPREKDAHLIVAAPDLYEALSDIVSSLAIHDLGPIYLTKEIIIASAALAKARGES